MHDLAKMRAKIVMSAVLRNDTIFIDRSQQIKNTHLQTNICKIYES